MGRKVLVLSIVLSLICGLSWAGYRVVGDLQVLEDAWIYQNVGIGTTTGNARLTVIGGNVGIGTTSPREKVEIDGNLYVNDVTHIGHAEFDLTHTLDTTEGRLAWNDNDGTLELGMPGGNVALQLGQEHLIRARNQTGSQIDNGNMVYVSGESGNKPLIALADNDDSGKEIPVGMTTEDIGHNNNGYVTVKGLVRGIDTSIYSAGTQLYLSSTPGKYTNTRPSNVQDIIVVGQVITSGASGTILIDIRRAKSGWEDLNGNVVLTTTADHVGIGTSSPRGELEVDGSVYVIGGNVGIGTTIPSAELDIENASPTTLEINSLVQGIGGCDSTASLLIHGNTDISDSDCSGIGAKTLNNYGAVTIGAPKFGAGSMSFSGTNNLYLVTSSDLQFSTGDFSVDFWMKSTDTWGSIFNLGSNGTGYLMVGIGEESCGYSGGEGKISICGMSSGHTSGAVTVNDGNWHHVMVVRSGTALKTYIDGTLDLTAVDSNEHSPTGTTFIGSYGINNNRTYIGLIDELRISKSARKTGNFSVETVEYDTGTGSTSTADIKFKSGGTTKWTIGHDGADLDNFKIGTTSLTTSTRLSIDSSGNVGITTTAPQGKLAVDGSIYQTAGNVLLGLNSGNVGIGDATPDAPFEVVGNVLVSSTAAGDGNVLAIKGTNVGIGTTVPNVGLSIGTGAPSWTVAMVDANDAYVKGDVEIDGALYVDGFIYGNGSKLTGVSSAGISGVTAGYIPRAASTTTITDSVIYQNGLNIGIGTTVPTDKLTVESSAGGVSINGIGGIIAGCDAYTSILVHADTDFTDSNCNGSGAKSVTPTSVTNDAANKVFGAASASFNGSSSKLSYTDSADFTPGTGNFTVDFWLKLNDVSGYRGIYTQTADGNNYTEIYLDPTTNRLNFQYKNGGTLKANYVGPTWTATGFAHIALVRNGATLTLYINGVAQTWVSTPTPISTNDLGDISAAFVIGTDLTYFYSGQIDEFRFSKGIARWTTDFTVPSGAYGAISTTTTPTLTMQSNGSAVSKIFTDGTDSQKFKIGVPATTRLTIDTAGNVGIGTTVPQGLLAIDGSIYQTTGNALFNINGGNLGVGDATPDLKLEVTPSFGVSATAAGDGNYLVVKSGNVGINTVNPRYKIEIDGTLYAGSTGGQTEIEPDGSIYLYGTATVWDDLQIQLTPSSAVNAPSVTTVLGGRLYTFSDETSAGNEDSLPFVAQFPHSYRFGSPIDVHVHWMLEDNTSCNVRWKLTYNFADINKTFPSTGTTYVNAANNTAASNMHNYAHFGDITPDTSIYGGNVSTLMIGTISRNSSDALDTCNSKSAYLLQADLHLEMNTLGSRTEYIK